jgi:hypothetical protein
MSFHLLYRGFNVNIASRVWESQAWDYRVLQNNCQTFASRLMQSLTEQPPVPKTISDLVKPFVKAQTGPSKPLRSTMATTTLNSHHTPNSTFPISSLAEKRQIGFSAVAPRPLGEA